MNDNDRQLNELFSLACRACIESDSTRDFEPRFADLLDFIRLNPQCREEALRKFLDQVLNPSGCLELLEYCMYELRWTEVKAKALEVIAGAEDWRLKSALSHVVEAFEKDWPGAKMYQRWGATTRT